MLGTLQLVAVSRTPTRIQSFMAANEVFMIVNPDIINPIYVGNDIGQQVVAVPPLGSATLGGDSRHDVWVSTNGGNYIVNAYLMPEGSNWTPSPAQTAAQIAALGLAKDTTVQTTNNISGQTNTILGNPSQETGNLATAANQLTTGVAPLVPNYGIVGNHGLGPQITAITGPVPPFRIWHIALMYGMYANGALASGQTGFAAVRTHVGGLWLNVVDNGIGLFSGSNVSGSAQSVVSQVMPLNGFPIAVGESLDLNVNGNTSLTNILQRCSYSIYYSQP